ncbi:MAG: UDP-N-acetylglucosamine 2-epimerase (non-hydrolyzing) [Candidatus Korarchaeota archaeon NZ13-K]|nr:MAG: UDP-N-acetylglucosamine 2-epimerase (non-hydrolyzing) [Candidatus Korarchaeota archaeon NZ13-K]
MRLLVSVGTRPEIIKMAPLYEALSRIEGVELLLVHTGQHYDWEMSGIFFRELGIEEPDVNLSIGSDDQVSQTSSVIREVGKVIESYRPDGVIALGDTNSVLGTAIASSKTEVPFIHVEAGLRSFDFTMPEEVNRRISDHLASLNFAPTVRAFSNLVEEGIPPKISFLSGNTIVDSVVRMLGKVSAKNVLSRLELDGSGPLVAVTVHRKENTDYEYKMLGILKALEELDEITFVWPIHPRTRKMLKHFNLWNKLVSLKNVRILDPLGYLEFLGLLLSSDLVLTDSGGVQEEAVTLKRPCIILRENTERPEVIELGFGEIAGTNPSTIVSLVRKYLYQPNILERLKKIPNPFGDGNASKIIASVISNIWDLRSLREGSVFRGGSPHYVAFRVEEWMRGYTVASLKEMSGYEVVSLYDADGKSIQFDEGTPLIPGQVVRIRGDPSNYGRLRKLMRR